MGFDLDGLGGWALKTPEAAPVSRQLAPKLSFIWVGGFPKKRENSHVDT